MNDNTNDNAYEGTIFTRPGYSLSSAGSLFLGIMVLWMLNGMVFLPVLSAVIGEAYIASVLLTAINSAILMIAVPILYLRRRSIDHKAFVAIEQKTQAVPALLVVLLAVAVHLMCRFLQLLWYAFLQWAGIALRESTTMSVTGIDGLVFAILFVAIAPAISEEFLFRGFLLRAMDGVYGRRRALIYTAVLFCLMHRSLSGIPTTLFMGLITGYAVQLTGNLKYGMLMHFTHNFISILFGYIGNAHASAGPESLPLSEMPELAQALILFAVGLCAALLILFILRRIKIKSSPPISRVALPLETKYDFVPFYVGAFILVCFIAGG